MDVKKLKGIMVTKGYTQEVLADKLGMSTKTYNRKELGMIEFNRRELSLLIDLLDLTLEQVKDIFFTDDLPFVY